MTRTPRATARSRRARPGRLAHRPPPAARRGRMLADLARRHRLVGAHRDSVEALLGAADCHAPYDDEPCYAMELGGRRHDLQFGVDHADAPGRVVAMRLARR